MDKVKLLEGIVYVLCAIYATVMGLLVIASEWKGVVAMFVVVCSHLLTIWYIKTMENR